MEGVRHNGGDGKMSLVVLSSATIAIFEESDAILEEAEFPAVHYEYEALVAVPRISDAQHTVRAFLRHDQGAVCVQARLFTAQKHCFEAIAVVAWSVHR